MSNFKTKTISADKILQLEMKEFPFLLKNVFPMYGVCALGGSSDLGKSYLLQQLAVAVATNAESFLGFELNINIPSAIYVSTEDDKYAMNKRLQNFERKTDGKPLENLRFMFDYKNLVEQLDEELKEDPASLVVIDTFADVFSGAINDSIAVRNFLGQFRSVANKNECLIIFNHHCSKHNDNRPPSKDNLLGSQGFESSMRTVIELRQDLNSEDKRHLCIVKGNHVAKEYKQSSFELNYDFETGFLKTENRVPFNQLCTPKKGFNDAALYSRILKMSNEKIPVRQITVALNDDGIKIGKSKVGEIVKNNNRPLGPG